jgi:ABC-type glycerol-3-phosphate transport system substrate-binding protein
MNTESNLLARIDHKSPIPIYHQLKVIIQEQIENGLWGPGDRLPTEQEICQRYNISRSPVRQAFKELEYEGLVFRRPGLGTFVEDDKIEIPADEISIQTMSSDPRWSRVLNQASSFWNKKHTNSSVHFEVDVVSHNQLYSLLVAAVGDGTAPDVAMVDSVWVADLAKSGFLYALDDQVLYTQHNCPDFTEWLYPAFLKANSYNGKLYGLPAKADASLLWYRKDWFAQEGIEPPHDWNDLLTIVNHFLSPQTQKKYGYPYPLVFPGGTDGGEATVYNLMPFIWSTGSNIFDKATGAVTLDTPGTRRALLFLRELVSQHHASPVDVVNYDENTTPRLFAAENAVMALGGSYESDIILGVSGWDEHEFYQHVGYVSPPAVPGGRQVSTVGGISYVLLRQCSNPALVLEVLKRITNPDTAGDLYRSILQILPCPSITNYLSPEVDPLLTQTSQMIASGNARPAIPDYVKISRQLQTMFEAAIASDTSVDDIVRRTAEFIGVISERQYKSHMT